MFLCDSNQKTQSLVYRFGIRKYLCNVNVKHDSVLLQKAATLGDLSDFEASKIVFRFKLVF